MKQPRTIEQLSALVPAARRYRLFNFAATAPLLQPAAEHMAKVAHQGTEPLSCHFDEWLALIESGRKNIANLVNASPDEISFVGNTSTGLSLIAASIPWQAGDRVLYDASDFPSNRLVWDNLKRFDVIAEPITHNANRTFDELIAEKDLHNIKLVACSAVSYVDGRQTNIPKLVEHCHNHNTLVSVDAIQAVGHIPVNLRQWGCDFAACGGQKWLMGPVGSGFIYLNASLHDELHVPLVGWASIKNAGDFQDKRLCFIEGARRLEPGLPDIGALAGLSTSIETLSSVGIDIIQSHIQNNANHLRAALDAMGYKLTHYPEIKQANGILCLDIPQQDIVEKIAGNCQDNNILITKRDRQIRLAPHAITTSSDMDALLDIFSHYARHATTSRLPPKQRPRGQHDQLSPPTQSGNRNRIDKWALVTGASRGLGEAIAMALAKRGYNLTLIGRELSKLRQVASNIETEFSRLTEIKVLNLNNRNELTAWLATLPDHKQYDVIVNNAAQGDAQLFTETTIEKVRELFEINVFAALTLTQHFLPAMLKHKTGAILNIVTTGSRCAMPLFTGYNASKAALWAWSEALGREVVDQGINVTTYLPPHMSTNMANYLGRRALPYFKRNKTPTHHALPYYVGEHAVKSLLAGRSLVLPLDAKIKLIVNAISDKFFSRSLTKSWRGAGQYK